MSKTLFGGLDEVGYGALAGPFVSVVAVFSEKDLKFLPGTVTDSKKLSPSTRETLYDAIMAAASDIGIGHAWPWEIDSQGVFTSLQLSYTRAIEDLTIKPTTLYVDGQHNVRTWRGPQIVEPKADLNYRWVSAASIVAKVWRDRLMKELARMHPKYGWDNNSGYGTPEHESTIKQHGLVIGSENNSTNYVHRKRYCRKFLIK